MKLYKYGIRGVAYDWIKSYLEERKQYVSFKKHDSSTMDIKCGVSQGSILGPLLFLIYVNDISNVSSILLTLLFADDTNVFVTGKIYQIYFQQWIVNSVVLNDIVLNCEIIETVEHFKFLGVHIDSKLNWSYHIQCIRKKMSKGIVFCKGLKIIWNMILYCHCTIVLFTPIWCTVLKYGDPPLREILSNY